MESINNIINYYNVEIILGLIIGLLLILILFIIYINKTNKSIRRYNKLLNGRQNISLEDLLNDINRNINNVNNNMTEVEERLTNLDSRLGLAIQKVGFIRYNAFDDIGSQLSFSIALLDEFKNGFILTSIYGRNDNVIYGKEIKGGTSKTPLSAEEIIAIDRALKGHNYE